MVGQNLGYIIRILEWFGMMVVVIWSAKIWGVAWFCKFPSGGVWSREWRRCCLRMVYDGL